MGRGPDSRGGARALRPACTQPTPMEVYSMRSFTLSAVAALSLLSTAAMAAPQVGAMVKTSDGKRVGRIYQIDHGQTAVIFKGTKAIKIDVGTLSGEGKELTTSLSAVDIAKQK